MEHFPIVHAICRMALVSPSEALTHQVERLSEALVRAATHAAVAQRSTLKRDGSAQVGALQG